ncbi:NUT family member 2-like [Manis javanica]|uniref:NUT family member 2-like n=1 Tax=Manis javanica TaxID=9974 RepID=UPI003C6CDBC3
MPPPPSCLKPACPLPLPHCRMSGPPYILGLFRFQLALPEWDSEQLVEEAALSDWTGLSMWNGQAAAVGSQPMRMTPGGARIPEKAGATAPATAQAHRYQRSPHTEALIEIPPKAVTDGLDITEGPLGPGGPAEGAPGGERGDESSGPPLGEEGDYPDPGLLTYLDKLCAEDKYFLAKVDVVLHPRFLVELLSPHPELDLLALAEELEKEEGLSILQLEHRRLLELRQEEEDVQASLSHGAPRLDSRPSVSEAGQSPQRPGLSPAGPPAAKASRQPPCAGTAPAKKTPLPGASLGDAGGPALGLGLGCPSQAQKRKGDPFVPERSKKRPCSQ